MKTIILTLLFSVNLFSQNNKANYSVKLLDHSNVEKSEVGYLYSNSKQKANSFSYTLLFSNERANFFIEENLNLTNTDFISIKMFSRYKGFIFTDTLFNYTEKNIGAKRNILKTARNKAWELTNESKIIQNFTCYKATSKEIIKNNKGDFEYLITAWYCPEIPYQFGPNGFGGLPGLIFELQFDTALYGLTNLILNDSTIKIEEVDETKILTQEEFNKKMQEIRKNY